MSKSKSNLLYPNFNKKAVKKMSEFKLWVRFTELAVKRYKYKPTFLYFGHNDLEESGLKRLKEILSKKIKLDLITDGRIFNKKNKVVPGTNYKRKVQAAGTVKNDCAGPSAVQSKISVKVPYR